MSRSCGHIQLAAAAKRPQLAATGGRQGISRKRGDRERNEIQSGAQADDQTGRTIGPNAMMNWAIAWARSCLQELCEGDA